VKKIGLICLAVVLALGAMGGALAYWNETLTVTGSVATGQLDVQFSDQKSNDDGTLADPSQMGAWTIPDPKVPANWNWVGTRYEYNVGKTTCELIVDSKAGSPEEGDKQTLKITVDNAYPCYYGNVAFTIDNIGTIPAHVKSIKLISLSKGAATYTLATPRDLVVCHTWYIDYDAPRVEETPSAGDDFSIHLSGDLEVSKIIAVDGALPGDICVHVEEGAAEVTTYDFTILIVVEQFNAP
jgi:predicted ribosomally synthesized peptide with SipW-like signal peptide